MTQTQSANFEETTKHLEREYLKLVADLLKKGQLTPPQVKQSAQKFLDFLPFANVDDAKEKIKQFTESFTPLKNLHLFLIKYEKKKKTQAVLARMSTLMKKNDLDGALKLAK